MPIYEYECSACRYYAEVMQKINDAPLKKCLSCGKNTFTKLISAPVFRLKGSGWYETDFKSDQDKKRNLAGADKDEAKSETKADAPAEVKADAKSDAATVAKTEPKAEAKPKEKPAAVTSSASRSARGKIPARKAAPAVKRPAPKRRAKSTARPRGRR